MNSGTSVLDWASTANPCRSRTAIDSSPARRLPAYGWYCQLAKAQSSLCEIEEALDVFKEGTEATGMSRHLRHAYRHGSMPPRTAFMMMSFIVLSETKLCLPPYTCLGSVFATTDNIFLSILIACEQRIAHRGSRHRRAASRRATVTRGAAAAAERETAASARTIAGVEVFKQAAGRT